MKYLFQVIYSDSSVTWSQVHLTSSRKFIALSLAFDPGISWISDLRVKMWEDVGQTCQTSPSCSRCPSSSLLLAYLSLGRIFFMATLHLSKGRLAANLQLQLTLKYLTCMLQGWVWTVWTSILYVSTEKGENQGPQPKGTEYHKKTWSWTTYLFSFRCATMF